MRNLITEYPYVDFEGNDRNDLIKTYAVDDQGNRYCIKQIETGIEYNEAVDVYPSKYTYVATDKMIEHDNNE